MCKDAYKARLSLYFSVLFKYWRDSLGLETLQFAWLLSRNLCLIWTFVFISVIRPLTFLNWIKLAVSPEGDCLLAELPAFFLLLCFFFRCKCEAKLNSCGLLNWFVWLWSLSLDWALIRITQYYPNPVNSANVRTSAAELFAGMSLPHTQWLQPARGESKHGGWMEANQGFSQFMEK